MEGTRTNAVYHLAMHSDLKIASTVGGVENWLQPRIALYDCIISRPFMKLTTDTRRWVSVRTS